jgi:leucyl-tRNA synthetase
LQFPSSHATDFSNALYSSFHKTIKKVSEDVENLKFNTAIAALMSLLNEIYVVGKINHFEWKTFLQLLCAFAPHLAEELWEKLAFEGMACTSNWPAFDPTACQANLVEIAIQINGKIKAKIVVEAGISKDTALRWAKEDATIQKLLQNLEIKKEIYVPGSLINFVV